MHDRGLAWKATAILSAISLGGACFLAQLWLLALVPLVFAALWLAAKESTSGVRPALFLAASTAFAALGIHLQLGVPLLLLGTAAALAAWDLAYFAECLNFAVNDEHRALLLRSHTTALVTAIASGLMLAVLGTILRLRLSFGVVSLLALILVLAISGIPRVNRAGARRSPGVD